MGKRSNFERIERDYYPTPYEAVAPLFVHCSGKFIEPCAGNGALIKHLSDPIFNMQCVGAFDIEPQADNIIKKNALEITEEDVKDADWIITNPPWGRKKEHNYILHKMIAHFAYLKPTWLLFDADWMHNVGSKPYLDYCEKIVSVGRVKWFEGSSSTGKDNCAWYLFDCTRKKQLLRYDEYCNCKTVFYGRRQK